MKSTKNMLIAGLALSIVLFASGQITAMAKKENPYLTEDQIEDLKEGLRYMEMYADPKEGTPVTPINEKQFKAMQEILYGNRAYTDREIKAAMYE